MPTKAQKNSFITIAEQVQLLNNNAVSLLTSMNKVVTSQDSSVNVVQQNNDGSETNYALPTVGKLQSDINILNNNIKRLSGLNQNTTHVIDGTSTKKIYVSDLNIEPNRIDQLSKIESFSVKNNWFFESLINPMLLINFDLTDKIGTDVDGIISRRYMIDFEKNEDDTQYTEKGQEARNEFFNNFVNKTNINYDDFIDWLTNPTNTGVYRNRDPKYDEQIFDFQYQEVEKQGTFNVMEQEVDNINNKLWYHIYPNKYTTSDGDERVLQVNDEIILNREETVTRWKILETSSSSSNFRIRVERVEGYDPIPTGNNMLKIYSGKQRNNNVQISVGFDEYLVVFAKPVNSKIKVKGSVWSQGTGLYTNDLVLDTDKNVSMSQYYLDTVYDYGLLLKDMIEKKIPSKYALKPNEPLLNPDNFKVVQINKHLTDTPDSKELKELHAQKINTKSKLEQVNSAITQKNKELSVKKYPSVAERNKTQNELTKLVSEQESLSKHLMSITTQIKSTKDTINKINAKFRIRGFWDIPQPVQKSGYRPQEVVQFEMQYRYSSATGTENQTEGYELVDTQTAKEKTGYFSNWVPYFTDVRKRKYDEVSEKWTWEIEDVADADTPNINQLDISIQPDEKVEIRVRSISEVGYPETKTYSDWSEVMVKEFPEDLRNIIDENEFILEEADQDNMTIEFEQKLDSKGINKHVSESFTVNEEYYAHTDNSIETVFKDNEGNPFSLQEYLRYLTDKINTLENIIYSAKGKLKITIFDGADEDEVANHSEINIDINCQNFATSQNGIDYDNKLYVIKDYYLKIENLSTSSTLSFLVQDSYISGTTVRNFSESGLTSLVDSDNDFVIQENAQFIYFCDNLNNENLYYGDINNSSGDLSDYINNTTKIVGLHKDYTNKGRPGNPNNEAYSVLGLLEVVSPTNTNSWNNGDPVLGTVICPQVNSIDDLIVDSSTNKSITDNDVIIVPINIYWKFKTTDISSVNINQLEYMEHNKKLRVRLHPSSISSAFDFVLSFKLRNKNITNRFTKK